MECDGDGLLQLEKGETFDKFCGQIYLTSIQRFGIRCLLCPLEYQDFNLYVTHILREHIDSSESLLEDSDEQFSEDDLSFETCELELQSLNDEVLEEEEIPIIELKAGISRDNDEKTRQSSFDLKSVNKAELTAPKRKRTTAKRRPPDVSNEDPVIPTQTEREKQLKDLNVGFVEITTDMRDVIKRVPRKLSTALTKLKSDKDKIHKCPICGTAFKERSNLRSHVKRHSKEKTHQCKECGKKFYTTSELQTHTRFHTQERNFLCSECGCAFLRNSDLDRHTKRHKNIREYFCSVCDKAFYNSTLLAHHMKSHSSERPITCTLCPATFVYDTSLKNHMKLHENKREYKCTICDTSFNQNAGLFAHMKAVHKTD